ncbi:MAG: hypothetical protein NC936_03000, partial [Candidatus Omnitrophica bacterium]|nr:hypothetical protein [Candidatus Omnitrophota bacterium]
ASEGGKVYLYAEGNAVAKAGQTIDISGGTISGDAGSAELSSGGDMELGGNFVGYANEPYKKGSFLIDPVDLTIDSLIEGTGDYTLTATGDIHHKIGGDVIIHSGSFTGQAGTDYIIDSTVSITADNNIEIRADNSITTAGDLTSKTGSIIFVADYDNNKTGNFKMTGGSINTSDTNSFIAILAGRDVILAGGEIKNSGVNEDIGIGIAAGHNINVTGTTVTSEGGKKIWFLPNCLDTSGNFNMTGGKIQMESGSKDIEIGFHLYWHPFPGVTIKFFVVPEYIFIKGGSIVNDGTGNIVLRAYYDIYVDVSLVKTSSGRIIYDIIYGGGHFTTYGYDSEEEGEDRKEQKRMVGRLLSQFKCETIKLR